MTWLLVGLLVLAAIGPIFWVLPSRNERRRMRLRNAAMAAGLEVRLRTFPDPTAEATERVSAGGRIKSPKRQLMTYRRPLRLPASARADAPKWRWLRLDSDSGSSRAPAGWEIDEASGETDTAYWQRVREVVGRLGDDVVAVEASGDDVAFAWLERGEDDAVEALSAQLEELAKVQESWTTSHSRAGGRDETD